jgi:outer membrane protein assembly factor BamB
MLRHCCLWLCCLALALPCTAQEIAAWRVTATVAAEEAHQGAAADKEFFYAIGSRSIGKYDRQSGRRVAVSSGVATHLNSGFFWQGKLLCAHSNYPAKPERSELFALDPATMRLTTFYRFEGQQGSLTWAVRHEGAWWCNFAFYDAENGKSYLARFDARWRETARWSYPPELIGQLGRYSLSGGVWYDGRLLATDHDHRVLYCLEVPDHGETLRLVASQPGPFAGQGIALDPLSGGLVGIDRQKKAVLLAKQP